MAFVLVKYEDGVKKIVPASAIRNFNPAHVNYTKKYKIQWDLDNEFYDGVIIAVGDTEAEVEEKASKKRHKITPIELCGSADEYNSSMRTTEDKDNIQENDEVKKIMTRKIESVHLNVDKMLKRKTNGGSSSPTMDTKVNVYKIAPTKNDSEVTKKQPLKNITSMKNTDLKKCPKVAKDEIKISHDKPQGLRDNKKPPKSSGEATNRKQISKTSTGVTSRPFKQENGITKKTAVKIESGSRSERAINGIIKAPLKTADEGKVEQPISITDKAAKCEFCNAQKKSEDAKREVINLKQTIDRLKKALRDKENMLAESSRLNLELQSKILDEFEHLKKIVADVYQRAQENLERHEGIFPIGYRRLDESTIHLGQDVWIPITQFDSISNQCSTAARFVKNMAIAVFGTTTLKQSSVTGTVSNRNRRNQNVTARPALDPTKLLAIKDALGFWLRTEKKFDEVSVDMEVSRVGSLISHKIFELIKKERKEEPCNDVFIPNVELREGNEDRDEEFNRVRDDSHIPNTDADEENNNSICGAGNSNTDLQGNQDSSLVNDHMFEDEVEDEQTHSINSSGDDDELVNNNCDEDSRYSSEKENDDKNV